MHEMVQEMDEREGGREIKKIGFIPESTKKTKETEHSSKNLPRSKNFFMEASSYNTLHQFGCQCAGQAIGGGRTGMRGRAADAGGRAVDAGGKACG
jgi:hypothetical protein